MTPDAALIPMVGFPAAVMLTVVYATGRMLPQFRWWRLLVVFLGFSLVTVPVPLLVYYLYDPKSTREVAIIIGSLYVLTVLVLGFAAPDKPKDT